MITTLEGMAIPAMQPYTLSNKIRKESQMRLFNLSVLLFTAAALAACKTSLLLTAKNTTRPVLLGQIRTIDKKRWGEGPKGNFSLAVEQSASMAQGSNYQASSSLTEGSGKFDAALAEFSLAKGQTPVVREVAVTGRMLFLIFYINSKELIESKGEFRHD